MDIIVHEINPGVFLRWPSGHPILVTMTTEEKKTTVEGKILNIKATKGQPMKIRLSIVDATGKELGSQDVSVAAPDVEAEADFKAEFTTDAAPAGWKYAIIK